MGTRISEQQRATLHHGRKSQRATLRRRRFEENRRLRIYFAKQDRIFAKQYPLPSQPGGSRFILHGKTPVPCPRLLYWANWLERNSRRVGHDIIDETRWVSTVFLGINHSFGFNGPPLLFETMVFEDGKGGHMRRYSTWDEARAGHVRLVEQLRQKEHIDVE